MNVQFDFDFDVSLKALEAAQEVKVLGVQSLIEPRSVPRTHKS